MVAISKRKNTKKKPKISALTANLLKKKAKKEL
jgi:hypothetical protein